MRHHKWETQAEFEAILKEIRTQNDREAGVTGAATAEYALQLAIEFQWPKMSNTMRDKVFIGDTAPLGTFSAKIRIAQAMGVIDGSTAKRFDVIRQTRNEFSHNMKPIDFATDKIVKLCDTLPDQAQLGGSASFLAPPIEDIRENMRWRFIETIWSLLLYLDLDQYSGA